MVSEEAKKTAEKIIKDLMENCEYTFSITGKPIIALNGDFTLKIAKEYGVIIKGD